jgi:phytoene dehydrogenase-like protein
LPYYQAIYQYDVLVYGATPAGIAAAVMASREGADFLLVEYAGHTGGMATSGLVTSSFCLEWTSINYKLPILRLQDTYPKQQFSPMLSACF